MADNLTPFSRALKEEIDARRGPSLRGTPRQEDIAAAVGRTQPYVSSRINGEYPWSADDLDLLAPLFGETAFSLVAAAGERARAAGAVSLAEHRNSRVGGLRDDRKMVAKTKSPDRGEEG